jgi:hypothetical protein
VQCVGCIVYDPDDEKTVLVSVLDFLLSIGGTYWQLAT